MEFEGGHIMIQFANEMAMDEHCDYFDFETWWEMVGNFKEIPQPKKEIETDEAPPF